MKSNKENKLNFKGNRSFNVSKNYKNKEKSKLDNIKKCKLVFKPNKLKNNSKKPPSNLDNNKFKNNNKDIKPLNKFKGNNMIKLDNKKNKLGLKKKLPIKNWSCKEIWFSDQNSKKLNMLDKKKC